MYNYYQTCFLLSQLLANSVTVVLFSFKFNVKMFDYIRAMGEALTQTGQDFSTELTQPP